MAADLGPGPHPPHVVQYHKDLDAITHSGPHEISAEQKEMNQLVFKQCRDIMPIDDIHKINDADLIYRFLIARKWKVEDVVQNLYEYVEFRKEHNLNNILWEVLPDDCEVMKCKFQGFDKFGHPVFYDCPEPKVLSNLLTRLPREVLLHTHFWVMEQGRRFQKIYKTDRVSCCYDMKNLTMGIVTNTKAVGFLKEISKIDQHFYPENMRTMCISNGGWTFNALWKVIRPLLDPRVQKKIQFTNTAEQVEAWIPLSQVPTTHLGGQCGPDEFVLFEDHNTTVPGQPPVIPGEEPSVKEPAPVPQAQGAQAEGEAPLPRSIHPPPLKGVSSGVHFGREDEPVEGGDGDGEDDDGAITFRSLPSDEDDDNSTTYDSQSRNGSAMFGTTPPSPNLNNSGGGKGSLNTTGGAVIQTPSPNRNPPAAATAIVSPPTILSESLPKAPNTVDMVFRNIGIQSPKRIEAYMEDQFAFFCTGQNVQDGNGGLLAELIVEAGHPIHTFLIVVDNRMVPRYICKKRKLHKEIHIFQPQQGAEVTRQKKMQALVSGERVHTYTCRPREGSNDQRDWQVTLHKDKANGVQGLKVGDTVRFQKSLASVEPHILFALSMAVTDLWFFS